MVNALTLLVLCQFAGEVAARFLGLPIPGPVLGMVLLLALLVLRERRGHRAVDPELKATAHGLLGHLSLLFIPAGVGIITQLDVLGRNWLPVIVAVAVSTFLGLVVTAWVMNRLAVPEPPSAMDTGNPSVAAAEEITGTES